MEILHPKNVIHFYQTCISFFRRLSSFFRLQYSTKLSISSNEERNFEFNHYYYYYFPACTYYENELVYFFSAHGKRWKTSLKRWKKESATVAIRLRHIDPAVYVVIGSRASPQRRKEPQRKTVTVTDSSNFIQRFYQCEYCFCWHILFLMNALHRRHPLPIIRTSYIHTCTYFACLSYFGIGIKELPRAQHKRFLCAIQPEQTSNTTNFERILCFFNFHLLLFFLLEFATSLFSTHK